MEYADCLDMKTGSAKDITYSLRGIDFPAEKCDLMEYARHHSANELVFARLDKIEDRVYDCLADVTKQVGTAG
ncbi:MAG: DUF2795 domain-containing protein [Thermodesulfobacteriota bacterium]